MAKPSIISNVKKRKKKSITQLFKTKHVTPYSKYIIKPKKLEIRSITQNNYRGGNIKQVNLNLKILKGKTNLPE